MRTYDAQEVEKARLALQEYAKTIPQLKRAAQEAYEVETAAMDHWVARFTSQCPGPHGVYTAQLAHLSASERTAPLPEAFAVLDSIADLVAQAVPPHGRPLELLRIQRVVRRGVQFTAVVAIVDGAGVARGYPLAIVWPTEDTEALERLAQEAR